MIPFVFSAWNIFSMLLGGFQVLHIFWLYHINKTSGTCLDRYLAWFVDAVLLVFVASVPTSKMTYGSS